jgi:7-cyano-7-deazaguanine synthase
MKSVLLLSGGLDSYTAGAMAKADGSELFALTIRYGQVHAREVDAARDIAKALEVIQHLEMDVPLARFGGSALVGDGAIPKDRRLDVHDIPSTYVPARNTVFLSLAMAWAEVVGAEAIVIGVNALDYSGYPDCRPEYLRAFEGLASLATKAGVEGKPLRVLAPLIQLSKAGIIRRGLALGVDYGLTHSCYDPAVDGAPCGRCDSCLIRARGFHDVGIDDPALKRSRS